MEPLLSDIFLGHLCTETTLPSQKRISGRDKQWSKNRLYLEILGKGIMMAGVPNLRSHGRICGGVEGKASRLPRSSLGQWAKSCQKRCPSQLRTQRLLRAPWDRRYSSTETSTHVNIYLEPILKVYKGQEFKLLTGMNGNMMESLR